MAPSFIQFQDVSLTLGERLVLSRINFEVRPGETLAIIGGSGSGKTTILRLMLGLYRPDAGTIRIDDVGDISTLAEEELPRLRRKMAMVFQGAALFDSLTVRENVGYGLWEAGMQPDDIIEERVQESLRFVGLEETFDWMPAEPSGGMRKRVAIARALARGAPLLLYDEPTAGLDPINTVMIARLILRLKERGVTQVIVTHDLETADRVADRLLMIHQTAVIFEGAPAQLRTCMDPTVQGFLNPTLLPTLAPPPVVREEAVP
jgi:phospholipid/cholesterol/gamma-HCH transport system ATP-binding protein